MLNIIYGAPGSGKTYACDKRLLDVLASGKEVVLLVPEQEAVDTENRIYDKAASAGVYTEKLSVVSFRRLANLAFRKYGDITYENIGDGGRLVLVFKIINELGGTFQNYKDIQDRTLAELMLSVCRELKRYCIRPSDLTKAYEYTKSEKLKKKLGDITLIYTSYHDQMKEEFADGEDDVARLAEIYKREHPNADTVFFLDSFNGFTYPELSVLESLIKHCSVTVTLNKAQMRGSIGFMTVEKTEKALFDICKELNIKPNILEALPYDNNYIGKDFKLIRDKLFDFSYASESTFSSNKISFAKCSDSFAQAEYIAISICKLVRSGVRYRDIAVLTRGSERYDGVLDVIFEKYGIPLFLSKRSPLTKTSLFCAVNGAIGIICDGYRTEDIIAYMKSGILNFSDADIDLLESYTSLWGIDGRRWTEDADWLMNPNGFTDILRSDTEAKLSKINSLRRALITPICELAEDIKNVPVSEACKAIYRFLLNSGISDFYRKTDTATDITVYNTFIDMLDTLSNVGGELSTSTQGISSLLFLMAKSTDFGKIPASFDRVTAGDASILRFNGIKHIFLTDCQSGVFPASALDDGFFSDNEKEFLSEMGIVLSPDIGEKNDLESFYFLRSATGAAETLTATYCTKDGKAYPSVGFQRLQALFPANPVPAYPSDFDIQEKMQGLSSANEVYHALYGTEYAEVLDSVCKDMKKSISVSQSPISDSFSTVAPDTINALFPEVIQMSASKLEQYSKCPFSYFCKNVLYLNEKRHDFFIAPDMGTYIHRILELSVKELYTNRSTRVFDEAEIKRTVNSATDEVLSKIIGSDITGEGKRFEALIKRLGRTVSLIVTNIADEFKDSSFTPSFFEFKIGGKTPDVPSLVFTLDEGKKISVNGSVDRIDTFKHDGNIYIRVVDYKSGAAKHSITNIQYGIDTQMLFYLFSVCAAKEHVAPLLTEDEFTGDLIPAGVLYQKARFPVKNENKAIPKEKVLKTATSMLVREGVLTDNQEILEAMEPGMQGIFLPVSKSKGELKAPQNTVISKEGFDALKNEIEAVMMKKGHSILNGDASAKPLIQAKSSPCSYCNLYPICRSKNSVKSEE